MLLVIVAHWNKKRFVNCNAYFISASAPLFFNWATCLDHWNLFLNVIPIMEVLKFTVFRLSRVVILEILITKLLSNFSFKMKLFCVCVNWQNKNGGLLLFPITWLLDWTLDSPPRKPSSYQLCCGKPPLKRLKLFSSKKKLLLLFVLRSIVL